MRFLLRSSRSMLFAMMVTSIVSGGLGGALIAVVNHALSARGADIWTIALVFLAVILARIATQFMSGALLARFAQKTVLDLTRTLCEQVLHTPYDRIEAMGSSRVLVTLTEDVSVLAAAVMALPSLVTNLALLVGCSIYIAWLSWKIFVVCALVAALGVLGHRTLLKRAHTANIVVREARDRLVAGFETLTQGLKELKLHRARRQDFMQQEIDGTTEELRRHNLAAATRYLVADTWSQMLFYVLIGSLLFMAPKAVTLTTEALTGYVFAALYMMTPTWAVLATVPVFLRGKVSLAKIREVGASLDAIPAEHDRVEDAPMAKRVRIEFTGVTYTYPARENEDSPFTVGPIDLRFSSGEVVFIAGGNGSGKSTLIKLLTGLYTPSGGRILLNGVVIDDGNRDTYREHFAAVFADYHLFDELFGIDSTGNALQIQEYLTLLRLDRKVRIEQGRFSSTALSSGQRKRLALLTAFLEDRPVYVFDEWAADQDPSYKEVFYLRLLPQLKAAGKCVIVVTHDDRYFGLGDRIIKLEAAQPISDAPDTASSEHRLQQSIG